MSHYAELLFRRNRGFSSAMIGYFGGDYWSHVDIIVPAGLYSLRLKRSLPAGLLGARSDNIGGGRGVLVRPFDYEIPLKKLHVRIPVSAHGLHNGFQFLGQQVGKPYDWRGIVGFAIDRDWRDDKAWFCSELGARFCEVSHAFHRLSLVASKINPGALALAASAIGEEVTE